MSDFENVSRLPPQEIKNLPLLWAVYLSCALKVSCEKTEKVTSSKALVKIEFFNEFEY